MTRKMRYPTTLLLTLVLVGCKEIVEVPVQILPLGGPLSNRESEVSGLAWEGDRLILMPENPEQFQQGEYGSLFYLTRTEIEQAVDGESNQVLFPKTIPFDDSGVPQLIPGYEGFEAIAFQSDEVFMTVEGRSVEGMMGYLVKGSVEPVTGIIRLDRTSLREVTPQTEVSNMSYESLTLVWHRLFLFHEINGEELNPSPQALVFDLDLTKMNRFSLPHLEYRLTGATDADKEGCFWVINYFWPGDTDIFPQVDPLAERFGEGMSHLENVAVERLVEFQVKGDKLRKTIRPPIYLKLIEDGDSRNWEGIARLDERGFLVVTDKYPETILAFVSYPEEVR
ncbi:MAG: hypothetical protein ACE5EE_02955 [Fidelibacterota bacterium]